MGRAIVRVKKTGSDPLQCFHTTAQGQQECTIPSNINNNVYHGKQAMISPNFDTPLIREELITDIGDGAKRNRGKKIPEGTFDSPILVYLSI